MSPFRLLCHLAVAAVAACTTLPLQAQSLSHQIKVDQFGYRPGALKHVIFADPEQGQNASDPYTYGSAFEIRRASDGVKVWPASGTAPIAVQNGGAVAPIYGDKVAWGDFSEFTTPGEYHVVDVTRNVRSPKFRIGNDVYNAPLYHATRMYFYNRANTAISATHGGNWTHALDMTGPNQMSQAQFYDTQARGDAKDMTGGWYDAGDYNKYVSFTTSALWFLLEAYERNPGIFTDARNLPESGNGVKDMLDEIRYELNWLLKMQETRSGNANYGGVYSIVGSLGGGASVIGDPAANTAQYYYSSATTWSTASFAASTAHAARIFASVDSAYSTTLRAAAERAWDYLVARPSMTPSSGNDTSNGAVGAGDSTGGGGADLRLRILAAAELYRLTGTAKYRDYFLANHNSSAAADNGHHPYLQGKMFPSQAEELNLAYMTYCQTTHPTDSTIVNNAKLALRAMCTDVVNIQLDAYRSGWWNLYYWSSNSMRAKWAAMLLHGVRLGVNSVSGASHTDAKYLEVAEDMLHYFHGRNALGMVYLTNMGPKGANLIEGKSPVELYHYWFGEGSIYDGVAGSNRGPAPGFLVGGPAKYTYDSAGNWDGAYGGPVTPPAGQPEDKSYLDFNTVWIPNQPGNKGNPGSYVVSEPGIYYQASYVLLLSAFAASDSIGAVATDGINSVTWPSSLPATGSFDVTVNVAVAGSRQLKVMIFDSAWNYLGGSFPTVSSSGSTVVTVSGYTAVSTSTANLQVELWDASGAGTQYDAESQEGVTVTGGTPSAPAAPSGLAASAVSATQINLTWTDNASNETAYKVERATSSGGPWTEVAGSLAANATSYSATGLTAATTYHFRVRCSNAGGNSGYSSSASATTTSSGGTGTITREVWTGIGGTGVGSIPVGTTPSSTGTLTSFEAPVNAADNYGQRVRGYVTPSSSGNYTFWIAADDNCELWLSTNDSPANKVRIAYHTSWTSSRQWNKVATQKSSPISLTGGTRYYIEALMKEGGGGDNLAVSWRLNSTTNPANGDGTHIIPGSALSPWDGGSGPTVPAAPSGLSATAASSSQINLAWTDNASNETTYKVERATASGGPWAEIAGSLAANTTTAQATGLAASTTYYFRVRCSNAAGNSGYSATASATTQAAVPPDTAVYSFESGTQGWAVGWGGVSSVSQSTVRAYAGAASLRVALNATAGGGAAVVVDQPANAAGKTVTFRVWVPSGIPLNAVQPFAQTGSGWTWTGNWVTSVTPNAWNTVTLAVPNTTPVQRIGVEFNLSGAFTGDCYVDSVNH